MRIACLWVSAPVAQKRAGNILQQAANDTLKPAKIVVVRGATVITKSAPFVSSGTLAAARAAIAAAEERARAADFGTPTDLPFPDLGQSPSTLGCGARDSGGNNRVTRTARSCATLKRESMSDYVLAGGRNFTVPYNFKVVSPVFPPPDGAQAGFNGDYSGLTINHGEEAHPIGSDTRNADPYTPANGVVHDEDAFTDKVGLPEGVATLTLRADATDVSRPVLTLSSAAHRPFPLILDRPCGRKPLAAAN